jgi:hypothetical protein
MIRSSGSRDQESSGLRVRSARRLDAQERARGPVCVSGDAAFVLDLVIDP